VPELPEVETTVNGLKQKVLERTFVDVWSDWKKIVHPVKSASRDGAVSRKAGQFNGVKNSDNFEEFKKIIKGKKIKNIYRRAKNIIFDLSDGHSLLVHQKMTGHLIYGSWKMEAGKWIPTEKGPLNDPYNRFLHIIFFFDNGKMMALSDVRKFAKIELWKTEDLLNSKEFNKLGPEPLDKNFTFEKFKDALKNMRGRIKQVLMDPNVIAGIGNIYASEVLWQAKIHPEKNVVNLNEKELRLLYLAIKKVLELAVKLGGESFSDYRKPDGSKGDFDTERKAYKREGEKCSRCGTKIKRIKFGGRSSFFCPKCQK
jgi:formamidopyrimidine-DNA glycosylase